MDWHKERKCLENKWWWKCIGYIDEMYPIKEYSQSTYILKRAPKYLG